MIVVTNTGPLIVLAKLNHLHLLGALYERVVVPQAVYYEAVVHGQARGYSDASLIESFLRGKGWVPEVPASVPAELQTDVRLGQGERQAIALAQERQALLLMDEVYARSVAERMGLRTVGSLGILVAAYRRGLLTADVLELLLVTIEARKDIWVHPRLCERVRREVLNR